MRVEIKTIFGWMVAVMCLLGALTGCRADAGEAFRGETVNPVSEEGFMVGFSKLPESVKAGESFEVEGYLTYQGDQAWELFHGADMFRYTVYDRNGDVVPVRDSGIYSVNGIGFMRTLEPGERYSHDGEGHVSIRLNELTIAQRGTYTIVAEAAFRAALPGAGLPGGRLEDYRQLVVQSAPHELVVR